MKKPTTRPPEELPPRQPEQKLYGRRLCAAVFATRPDDIRSVLIEERLMKEFAPLLKWCSQKKIAYNIKTDEQIAKVAKAVHHEGILLFVRTGPMRNQKEWSAYLAKLPVGQPRCFILLDGVNNPHNLGAMLRNAAHFGTQAIVYKNDEEPRPLPAAVARMSEGGSEHVPAFQANDLIAVIAELRKRGCQIVGTSSHAKESLHELKLAREVAFVIGSESTGMTSTVAKATDTMCKIPFNGPLQSLNAATAGALCMAEFLRAHPRK